MTTLVWFRTDLRVHDNPALWHAAQRKDDVLGVVFVSEKQWRRHGLGPRKIQLIKNRMYALADELKALNIPLLIVNAPTFAECNLSLQRACVQMNISRVNFNIEYEVNERHRDIEFARWCRENQIEVNKFHDQCLLPPGSVVTQQGGPFRVFTPFKKAWLQQANVVMQPPLPAPAKRNAADARTLETLARVQSQMLKQGPLPEQEDDPLWSVAEADAHDKLECFISERALDYKDDRDHPLREGTSRLSFELSLGILSQRQCLHAAQQENKGFLAGGFPGIDCWISELIWREFYRHLLVAFPDLCKHKAFKPETEAVPWRHDEDDFLAWCEGRTGYPIVDAAMRQLVQQGWMHNRLRMITAMFLTKHLLIDWRKGEAFFNHWLVDADLASNNGGWQWSASTGADGAPYFRIFNPTSQSEKFDASAEFIAQMVPELAVLAPKDRHAPDNLQRARCRYPLPVVNHQYGRARALEAFKLSQAQTLTEGDA
ncbi:deoxyribodipyrimidine photo-lyase [Thalassolituus sp. LLYu03]|uniref:deoxyribodipyrimidine photo-lyase n=1 Tax=Thalassolituus sp. LLYu03 TaxID=3421656 RepID=UPI003D28EDFA